MKDLVKVAMKIAKKAHKEQFRNDGKTPFVSHPIAVMENLKKEIQGIKWYDKNTPTILFCASLLHDVLEDTKITSKELAKKGIPKAVIDLIETLTHEKDESYINYILRIRKNRGDSFARTIKIEDIKHNLSTLEPWKKDKRDKYMLALYLLEN